MSTKKQVRRDRMRREREQSRQKKGIAPWKVFLLFVLAVALMFAAVAIFGDSVPRSDGRVWSPAHQHWH
ncbi:MAG: hypothetical protein HY704_07785 [Gemmatimonadetes bacterium]|nr:hypothetical protein [Gemmatimonadota bacterium]